MKLLPSCFHLNGQTFGFHLQPQNVRVPACIAKLEAPQKRTAQELSHFRISLHSQTQRSEMRIMTFEVNIKGSVLTKNSSYLTEDCVYALTSTK